MMNNRELIYESLNIIEENLESDLNIQGVAEKLGFSLFYFSRLFKGITGLTPKTYQQKRKLTRALEELRKGNGKIIDIAYDFGFGSPESFSRAFHRNLGLNPGEVRRGAEVETAKLLFPLTRETLEAFRKIPREEPELLEFGPLHLMGLSFFYENSLPEDLSTPWKNLVEHSKNVSGRLVPERFYQVQYWFENMDPGSIYFFLAFEVEKLTEIPIQFSAKTLPRQRYLKFLHRGLSNQVGYTYQYIYNEYLPETDFRLPHLFNFEYYPPDHKGPYSEESVSEIYIPIS